MTTPPRPVAVSLVWMVIGALALVLVTVGITVSVASVHTADRTVELLAQLQRANGQIDDLRSTYAAAQAQSTAAQVQSTEERNQLRRQNRLTREQLVAVLTYLREHGIDIPSTVVPQSLVEPPSPRPKGTGPRGPNPNPSTSTTSQQPHPRPSPSPSPRPTGGTTTGPTTGPAITDLICLLTPTLCP